MLAGLLVVWLAGLTLSAAAQSTTAPLCAYWQPHITQWADLIMKYAKDNGLDPNLVAALIEEESKGDSKLVSRAGAVGLMQIMPYEAGFSWRPHAQVLKNPEANLEWGTHTLSEVIRQAQGRATLAVLAYNSGWDRIHLRSTRLFATRVFDDYARCILAQHGFDLQAVTDYNLYVIAQSSAGPSYADRFKPDGTFEPLPDFDPVSVSPDWPHALAFVLLDEESIAWWVEVWVDATGIQPAHNAAKTTNSRSTE